MMRRSSFERIFEERGLQEYKIQTLDDLFYIYNVKMNQIDGYFDFDEAERVLIDNFTINYFNHYGLQNNGIAILKVFKEDRRINVGLIVNGEWKVAQLQLKMNN
ncbi:hypothetical protein NNC19_15550 [Clostridium sp. SHJSY1]|uniref:hypothetical protein n=1 Tax=Clostridium sp. SHJSY1 TaxID=2942483 RepID=UPI0028770D37|nr:hypothetical protein [Clostridium sp. SHJSY1]MDS0527106.1 hypothetical protein [Clostridium sp. SHJSY1]